MKYSNEEPPKASLFDLDKHSLDLEWERQPRLYAAAADALVEARADLEQAKAGKELAEAEADRLIRISPHDYGVEKTTEAVVKAAVIRSRVYQDAVRKYLEAKHAAEVLQVKVDALDHRKKALENLVHLFAMDYFSTPRVRGSVKDRVRGGRGEGIRDGDT